jgi:hypothetical protein
MRVRLYKRPYGPSKKELRSPPKSGISPPYEAITTSISSSRNVI